MDENEQAAAAAAEAVKKAAAEAAAKDEQGPNSKGWEAAKAAKEEAQKLRTERDEANKKLADIAAKEKAEEEKKAIARGEFDKITAEKDKAIADTTARLRSERVNNAIALAGAKAGVRDPEDLAALVRLGDEVNLDDPAAVKAAVDERIRALKTAKPYLFGEPQTNVTTSQGGPRKVDGFDATKDYGGDDVRAMTKEQRNELAVARGWRQPGKIDRLTGKPQR